MLSPARHKARGFTLLETLISLAILAIMSIMAYQAVEAVLNANQRSREDLADELELQQAWQILANDFLHLRARQYADGFGGIEAAYQTGTSDVVLSFTRGGGALHDANPTGLSRVQYSLDDAGRLIRTVWPVYVSARDSGGQQRVLLNQVSQIEFNHLGMAGFYTADWPPLDMDPAETRLSLPLMIEITIEMEDGSYSSRLIPGVEGNG